VQGRRFVAEPIYQLLPPLAQDDYDRLAADIRQRGVLVPIDVDESGNVLDGHHRLRIADSLGVECPRNVLNGLTEEQKIHHAATMNVARRQMDSSQKAALAVNVEERLAVLRRIGRPPKENGGNVSTVSGRARDEAAELVGTNPRYVSDAKKLKAETPDVFQRVAAGELTIPQAKVEVNRRQRLQVQQQRVERPSGKYQTIVIDPPWQMEKIQREKYPEQVGFDYPTMTEEELAAFPIPDLAEDDCHLYLWTTHKHLPMALRLAQSWGFRYQCLMTWVKNVGFTPYSWMYSTEHVLFCRKGSLDLLQKGRRLDFHAPRREHSRKPDEFYDLVRECSPGPRIDIFSREKRDGFDQYGNEAEKFDVAG
jgi:N6-adenosine-specific RNA methylase IME4/ParB-like chromosome segregation protein Spo0J